MDFECKNCGTCCKTYWITMLPAERKAMAQSLNLNEKQFTEKYCVLLLQLFPVPETMKDGLVLEKGSFPKNVWRKLEKKLSGSAGNFLALPSLALKRSNGVCVLFEKNKRFCLVHKAKPEQCSLFPFISLEENPDFPSLYSFCVGLKRGAKPKRWKSAVSKQLAAFSGHFEEIQKHGFKKTWKNWPKRGVVLLKTSFVTRISGKDFFAALSSLG